MAEQENVALIQKLLKAFARGDIRTIVESCAEDCETHHDGPAAIPYADGRAERSASYLRN